MCGCLGSFTTSYIILCKLHLLKWWTTLLPWQNGPTLRLDSSSTWQLNLIVDNNDNDNNDNENDNPERRRSLKQQWKGKKNGGETSQEFCTIGTTNRYY